jgi:hypothetical protein
VVIQNAGYGARWAAPIGSLLVEKYLRDTLTADRVKQATVIANSNLMPGYLVRLQFLTDSLRGVAWANQTGDSSRLTRYLDPSLRKELLDTLDRPVTHVTIPFGPKPQVPAVIPDTTNDKNEDSALLKKALMNKSRKSDSIKLHNSDSGRSNKPDSSKARKIKPAGLRKTDSSGFRKPDSTRSIKQDSSAKRTGGIPLKKKIDDLAMIPDDQSAVQDDSSKNKSA